MTESQTHRPHYYGNPNMLIRLDDKITGRSATPLKSNNIIYLGQLANMTESEFLRIPNAGNGGLKACKKIMNDLGGYTFLPEKAIKLKIAHIDPYWTDKREFSYQWHILNKKHADDLNKLEQSLRQAYGLSEDAKPTYGPSNRCKPSQTKFTSLVNSGHTPPIFTKDDFNVVAFTECISGKGLACQVTIPELLSNLMKDGYLHVDGDGQDGQELLSQTKATDFEFGTEEVDLLYHGDDGLRNLAETDIIQGFTNAVNIILPRAQKRAIDHLESKIEKRYGIKIP